MITKELPVATAATDFTTREREAGLCKGVKHSYQMDGFDPILL